jgi:hypothetical protein
LAAGSHWFGVSFGGSDQLCWPSREDGVLGQLDRESGGGDAGTHDGGVDVGERMTVPASPCPHALVIRVFRVIEVLIDEEQATATAQHPAELVDARSGIGPVMHHVDGPGSVDAGIPDGKMFGGSVHDLESLARAQSEPSHFEHGAHERRRIDCDDTSTRSGREDRRGTHPGTDVEDVLTRPDVERRDGRSIHRGRPHPWRTLQVPSRGAPTPVVRMSVVRRVVVRLTHQWIVLNPESPTCTPAIGPVDES